MFSAQFPLQTGQFSLLAFSLRPKPVPLLYGEVPVLFLYFVQAQSLVPQSP